MNHKYIAMTIVSDQIFPYIIINSFLFYLSSYGTEKMSRNRGQKVFL